MSPEFCAAAIFIPSCLAYVYALHLHVQLKKALTSQNLTYFA